MKHLYKTLLSVIFLLCVNQASAQTNDPAVSPQISSISDNPFSIIPIPSGSNECRGTGPNKGCYILTPQDNNGDQCPAAGNPINLGSGNKFQKFSVELNKDISFDIFYNSYRTFDSGEGYWWITRNMLGQPSWFANVEAHISPISYVGIWPDFENYYKVAIARPDGRVISYVKYISTGIYGEWTRVDPWKNKKSRLVRLGSTWEFYPESGQKEVYRLTDFTPVDPNYFHSEQKIPVLSKVYKSDGTYIDHTGLNNDTWISGMGYLGRDNFALDYVSVPYVVNGQVFYRKRLSKIRDLIDTSREWLFQYTNSEVLEYIIYPDSTQTRFHYDKKQSRSDAMLTGITDRRGIRYSTYTYEAHGLARTSELGNGINKVTVSYAHGNTDDFTRTVVDSLFRSTTYTIEKMNNHLFKVKDVTGPGCGTCTNGNSSYEYDDNNNIIEKTVDGVTTTYSIVTNQEKIRGQYSSMTVAPGTPEEKVVYFTWDNTFHHQPKTITESSVHGGSNKVTTYTYGSNGKPISIVVSGFKPDGTAISRGTTYEYNGPFGQISKIDGPRPGNIDETTFVYYPDTNPVGTRKNRLKRVEGPSGIFERNNIRYNANGDVTSEQRPNGVTVTNTYYPLNNRLETTSLSDGTTTLVTKYEYLATGQIEKVISNFGTTAATTLIMTYDDALRLTKITDSLGNYQEYVLDTEGNVLNEKIYDPSNSLKKIITQTFDVYNQVDTRTTSGVTVDYNYANNGTLSDIINGKGVVTDYSYDELNRMSLISQDYQGTNNATANTNTIFDYDVQDNINSVTDARGNTTLYYYDDLGNLTKLESPDTGITLYSYDEAGNMIQKTDANGVTVDMVYDGRGRLISTDYTDNSQDTTITYDQGTNGTGRMSSFTDESGSTTFEYQKLGSLDHKTQVVTGFNATNYQAFNDLKVDYTYDSSNRIQNMVYPSGIQLNYSYDGLNRIAQISIGSKKPAFDIASNIEYLPFGNIKAIDFGNGKNFSANFDNGYRLEDFSYGADMTTYAYDNNHNIVSKTDKSVEIYGYDALDRLSDHNVPSYFKSADYTYDKLGNRTAKNVACADISPDPCLDWGGFTYDTNSNQLNQIFNTDGTSTLNYDSNGNIIGDSTGEITTYNQANRMSTYATGGVTKAIYYYNAIGQRVRKTRYTTSGTYAGDFLYMYDESGQLLHESKYISGQHKWDKEIIWLNDRPIALVETRYSGSNVLTQKLYYIQVDHLNTPRWLTNDSGVTIWSWKSDPFGIGNPDTDVDGDGVNFIFNMRFPGQFYDQESGSHYNYYRDYDPQTGRYLQSDPISLYGGINTYSYVISNPLIWSDPLGLKVVGTWNYVESQVFDVKIRWGDAHRPSNWYKFWEHGGSYVPMIHGVDAKIGYSWSVNCVDDCDNNEWENNGGWSEWTRIGIPVHSPAIPIVGKWLSLASTTNNWLIDNAWRRAAQLANELAQLFKAVNDPSALCLIGR